MKPFITAIMLFIILAPLFAEQNERLAKENEFVQFSFKLKNGKVLSILLDKDEKYMVYRFGTEKKIELTYPEKLDNSFSLFTYSYYFRGGGKENEGLDLNYLSFTNNNFKYTIFHEYSAEGDKTSVGVRILNLDTNKEFELAGLPDTMTGSLVDFRFNDLVEIQEEK